MRLGYGCPGRFFRKKAQQDFGFWEPWRWADNGNLRFFGKRFGKLRCEGALKR